MSRAYNRYRQRNVADESPADLDRKQPEALAAILNQPVHRPTAVNASALLQVEELRVTYGSKKEPLRAVDGVSFVISEGESIGLVGESGCGKSSLGKAILRMLDMSGGQVIFDGKDIRELEGKALRGYRENVQMIFQDPFGSLNPRMTVGRALREVLAVHRKGNRMERRQQSTELFEAVGLDAAYLDRFPHEFSGGQRQRVGIARALAVEPKLIVADEPVSALDVSVQAQILNLLKDLQEERSLTYLFIAHDLAVVRYICDRILVMYLGRIVETSTSGRLYVQPLHPYTKALMSAVPDVEKALRERGRQSKSRTVLSGDIPSPTVPVSGCLFHTRCPFAKDRCREETPRLREVRLGHFAACHFAEDLADN